MTEGYWTPLRRFSAAIALGTSLLGGFSFGVAAAWNVYEADTGPPRPHASYFGICGPMARAAAYTGDAWLCSLTSGPARPNQRIRLYGVYEDDGDME